MENKLPLISVIIPVYNVEKYLNECVDSVICQTYTNLEILLIDDGSNDKSPKICDEYKAKDKRISVYHKKNGGLSDARNYGVSKAHGEYVSFIDSDDYCSPSFIETLYVTLINGECDLVALKGGTDFWDGEQGPRLLNNVNDSVVSYMNSKDVLEAMLYQNIATGAPFKFYKFELVKDIKFPYGFLYEDVATTYKYFLKANKSAIVYGDLYAYRKRRDSIIRQDFSDKKLVALDIFDQLLNDEELKKCNLEKAVVSRVYAMLFSVFLQIPEDNKELQRKLWNKLKTVQKTVMFDNSKLVRRKNKISAWCMLLGMNVTYKLGRKYGQKSSRG